MTFHLGRMIVDDYLDLLLLSLLLLLFSSLAIFGNGAIRRQTGMSMKSLGRCRSAQ